VSPAVDRLRDIEAITDAALARLNQPEFLAELLARTRTILQADTAAVLLLDRSAGQLIATAAAGLEEEVRQGVRLRVGQGFAGRIAAERKPVVLDRVDHTTVANPILLAKGIKALAGVPLIAGGEIIGVLHVGSLTPREFAAEDVRLLQLAAERAAAALLSLTNKADREAATALQRSLVFAALPRVAGVELAARFVPGRGIVGGDWYDVFSLPSGELCAVVGDVAGYTDGLVERRNEPIDASLARLCGAVALGEPEMACVAVMTTLVGSEPTDDDIALLMISRRP
jgi:phosphoserine phosphatase RsbU/P